MPINTKKVEKKRAAFALDQAIRALQYCRQNINTDFFRCVDILKKRKGKIVVCGVGKSAFVAMKMAATLTSLGHEALFIHPTDALHGDSGNIKKSDVLICFSFSGESSELLTLATHLKRNLSLSIIAVTGNKYSRLAKLADAIAFVRIDEEGCPLSLAPMASVTVSMAMSDMLTSAITEPHPLSKNQFARSHPSGSLGLRLKKVSDVMGKGRQLPLIKENQSLHDALVEMTKKGRGVVGVTRTKGILCGIITDGDVRRFFLLHKSRESTQAKDAMTKRPKIISSERSLMDALNLMTRYSITSLFVTKKEKLVGIISMHDIIGKSI